MKKLLLFLAAIACGVGARAQCNASLTWTQTPGTHTVQFNNTSTWTGNAASTYVARMIHLYATPGNPSSAYLGAVYSNFSNPGSFTFGTPGTYGALAQIETVDSSTAPYTYCYDTTWYTVTVTTAPCYSTIAMTGTGATRTFTATTPANTAGMSYSWHIGGTNSSGITLTGNPITYTFPANGTYWVTLTATGGGCTDTAVVAPLQITTPLNCGSVSNNITLSTPSVFPASLGHMNASIQNTPYYQVQQHAWNWGDGSPIQTFGFTGWSWSTSHTYATAGTYTVTAVTTWHDSANNITCMDTATSTVNFNPSPCAFYITASGTGPTRTYTAHNVTNNSGATYTWNFGDGTTGTGNPVTHTFAYSGYYNVTASSSIATPACSYNASKIDAVTGPLNCANISYSRSSSGGNNPTKTFWVYTSSTAPTTGFAPTHNWDFGDGSSSVGATVTHTYQSTGSFNVRLITNWAAIATPNLVVCADTTDSLVVIGVPGFNCATASNSFTATAYGLGVSAVPTVTPSNTAGVTVTSSWSFGNGGTQSYTGTAGTGYSYPTAGTYTIRLVTTWLMSGTSTVLCRDTAYQTVTVAPLNMVAGSVQLAPNSSQQTQNTFRIWLITYNPTTNMLAAVDSVDTVGYNYADFYFHNKPAGIYRTKAAIISAQSTNGYIPTYLDSALTWNTAQSFTHNNAQTWTGSIFMRQGTVTSGPGFIGGNVLQGANKGTADGDPVSGQFMLLYDASGRVASATRTDAQGSYSFPNLPIGSYTVYPEALSYTTTPSSVISITAAQPSVSGINFRKDEVSLTLKPGSVAGIRGVAASTFRMAPNPATTSLTIDFGRTTGTADVRVLNVAGQTVHTLRHSAASPAVLDVSALPAGVYSVQVSTAAGTATEKLVIVR